VNSLPVASAGGSPSQLQVRTSDAALFCRNVNYAQRIFNPANLFGGGTVAQGAARIVLTVAGRFISHGAHQGAVSLL
jgi:hypothetical protein